MDRKEIVERVNAFLIDEFEIEEEKLQEDADLKKDVGIDSLDYVDIVVSVKREFGFKIQNGELTDVKTLRQFYDYIAEKLSVM